MAIIQKAIEPFTKWNPKPLDVRSNTEAVASAGRPASYKSETSDKTDNSVYEDIATEAVKEITKPIEGIPKTEWGLNATPDENVDSSFIDKLNSIDLDWSNQAHRTKLLGIQRKQEWSGYGSDVSTAGAKGPAQFLDSTWKEAKRRGWVPKHADVRNPHWAKQAQEKYMDWIYNYPAVKNAPTETERVKRMLAAYNNGIGNVASAVERAAKDNHPNRWYRYLSTGSQKETIGYMEKILKRFSESKPGSLLITRKHGGILYNNSNNKNY